MRLPVARKLRRTCSAQFWKVIEARVWFPGLDAHFSLTARRPSGPAPARRNQAAGEFVDDDDLAVLHHVLLIAVVRAMGTQRRVEVMHQQDIGVMRAAALGRQLCARGSARRSVARLGGAAPGCALSHSPGESPRSG